MDKIDAVGDLRGCSSRPDNLIGRLDMIFHQA